MYGFIIQVAFDFRKKRLSFCKST